MGFCCSKCKSTKYMPMDLTTVHDRLKLLEDEDIPPKRNHEVILRSTPSQKQALSYNLHPLRGFLLSCMIPKRNLRKRDNTYIVHQAQFQTMHRFGQRFNRRRTNRSPSFKRQEISLRTRCPRYTKCIPPQYNLYIGRAAELDACFPTHQFSARDIEMTKSLHKLSACEIRIPEGIRLAWSC